VASAQAHHARGAARLADADTLADGRPLRALNIVDELTRECPLIAVDRSLPGARMVRTLVRLCAMWSLPDTIVSDNPAGFAGRFLDARA
jgi:putative transposase